MQDPKGPLRWTQRKTSASHITYTRPYGLLEQSFYWDTVLNGTADCLQICHLEVPPDSPLAREDVFSEEKIGKAWIRTKMRHPLLGAVVRGPVKDDDKEGTVGEVRDAYDVTRRAFKAGDLYGEKFGDDVVPHFLVDPALLSSVQPNELHFLQCASQEQALQFADEQLLNSARRPIGLTQLAQLYFLFRTDDAGKRKVHFIPIVAHAIVDGMGMNVLIKDFLEALTAPDLLSSISKECKLEERLALALPLETLWPGTNTYSAARRRWRKAIGSVIYGLRQAKMKGGHTLPRRFTSTTPYTPACSTFLKVDFTPNEALSIITTCRKHSLTFGHAFYVLGQVSMARIFLRRYARGDMSPAEWEFRKREPWHSGGPANIRPMLDEKWYNAGGQWTVCTAIGFFFVQLPPIPVKEAEALILTGAEEPGWDTFLTSGRFLLRCGMIKRQVAHQMRHPLFLEIGQVRMPLRVEMNSANVLKWREIRASGGDRLSGAKDVPVEEQSRNAFVFGHIGSSLGDMTNLIPRTYPSSSEDAAQLRIDSSEARLHCRPAELYLGSSSSHRGLSMQVYFDGRTYDEALVQEWLAEVKSATLFYLAAGLPAPSRM